MSNLVQFPGLGLEFQISRVAFSIGGMNVYWYGIIIALGLLLGAVFAFHYAPDFGIDGDRLIDVIMVGAVCAIVCARAFYVAFAPFEYESIWDMINLRDGGIAIYGAVIGAFLFGALACKWRKQPVLATYDVAAMGFLIGQCVGRWGNFMNQEAFGCNTDLPWGMISQNTRAYLTEWQATLAAQGVMVDPNSPVHPTFLYESLWCLVGFLALWAYMKKRRFNGEVALLYVIWYGLGRFWIEGLRTDSLMTPFMNLRVSQLIALVSVLAALAVELWMRHKHKDVALAVPLAINRQMQSNYQKQWKAAGGPDLEEEAPLTMPAGAFHAEFVDAAKRMNQDRYDCTRIAQRIADRTAAEQQETREDEDVGTED